ncbi:hypothetical protein chiPu_0027298, partial [Chiloscyllium punctatum]|nr:hypothetical protein [Chiloscyllium punctatum]
PEYLSLEELCEDMAVELLGMCRNQSEVNAVLNDCGEETIEDADNQAFEEGIPNLGRLRLAVNYNQKRVSVTVAQIHPSLFSQSPGIPWETPWVNPPGTLPG